MSENIKDLEQTNELVAYVIHEVLDNLQKIMNGSTEESEDDTRNEQLDHLELNNYDVFIELLIMNLRGRAQLETKNREYNLDLLRRIKDLEESNRNHNNPAKDLKLMELQTKIEADGRVFCVSDNSSTIVDCLLNEARQRGATLQTGKFVTLASISQSGKFILKIKNRTIDYVDFVEADYLLIASGISQ
ncbi:unnamed protein product [Lactuca saligna]|uniref:Uncharacterized protein n=1 Tax=Lactuca saligna TaxID=75948 RepID=A0AA35UX17_LACSI|nr:unnamed protein product [Lactuca saligna]